MNEQLLIGDKVVDDRGSVSFVNDFDFKNVKRFYVVENHQVNFIRAWHGHKYEGKYVFVVSGAALVGVVSLDGDSLPNKYVLSADKPRVLWIPPNYANGFMTLRSNTKVMFFSTSTLAESLEDDIRFDFDRWDIWTIEQR